MSSSVPFRPIVPGSSLTTPHTTGSSSTSARSGRNLVPGWKKRVSTACLACKKSKRKCSGTAPCDNCRALRRECIFDESLDQRRRIAAKRTAEELEYHRDMLNDLLRVIRSAGEQQALKLMALIRNDATPEEIRLFIDEVLADLQATEPPSRDKQQTAAQLRALRDSANMQGSAPSFRRKVMDANFLCDNPPIQVPARPWTAVTDDDAFVSHLVSLYFTWDYPFFAFLDRDVLVKTIRIGDIDSDFCSPFLVNALLAHACTFSEYSEAYGVLGDVATKGQKFLREAEKYYKEDSKKLKLASLQGILVLHEQYSILGRDDLGYTMLKEAADLAVKMGYVDTDKEDTTAVKDVNGLSADMTASLTRTIWGLFQVDTVSHTGFLKPSRIKRVLLERPPRKPIQEDSEPWEPYPSQKQPRPAYFVAYFDEACTLSEISRDISSALFTDDETLDDDKERLSQTIEHLYQTIRRWRDNLPAEFNPERTPPPHIILLHIRYYTVLINMFNCPRGHNPQSRSTQVDSQASEGQGSGSLAISSARQIAKLVSIHHREYGMSRSHIFALYAVNLALFVLLERGAFDISDPDCIALTSAFAVITTRSTLGHRVLSIFRHSVLKTQQSSGATRYDKLPEGLRQILDDKSSTYFFESETEDSRSTPSVDDDGVSTTDDNDDADDDADDDDDDDDDNKTILSPMRAPKSESGKSQQQQDGGGLCEMLCRYEVMSLGRDEHV